MQDWANLDRLSRDVQCRAQTHDSKDGGQQIPKPQLFEVNTGAILPDIVKQTHDSKAQVHAVLVDIPGPRTPDPLRPSPKEPVASRNERGKQIHGELAALVRT